MPRPDMTGAQFAAACKRRGFVPQGFMGYHRLPDTPVHVSAWNAGPTRREQLAYLIEQQAKLAAKEERKTAGKAGGKGE